MQKIRKGDEVIVITGRDKGKRGTVLRRVDDAHLVVEGINVVKKHVRPNPMKGETGGIVEKSMPIDQSNLMLLNPATGKGGRVGINALEDRPPERQYRHRRGHGGQRRAACVDDQPDGERSPPADDVADLAAGEHQHRHDEAVQGDDRLDGGDRGVEVVDQLADRDVHHRLIEHHDELRRAQRDQRQPLLHDPLPLPSDPPQRPRVCDEATRRPKGCAGFSLDEVLVRGCKPSSAIADQGDEAVQGVAEAVWGTR